LSRSQWLSITLLGLAFVILWLDFFALPLAPVGPALDLSWCGALLHFSALKLQFGKDVIFTYGPLGHLISFVYTGELFGVRVAWELLSKTLFAAILCGTMLRLPAIWRPFFLLFILLFIWADPISDALYFLVFCCVAAALFAKDASRVLNLLAGSLFAVGSLIKFNYFLLATFILALVLLLYASRRRFSHAVILGVAFLTVFCLCWKIAGQEFAGLPAYLVNSLDISFGYKEAMGWPAESNMVVIAGLVAAGLAMLQCLMMFWSSRELSTICIAIFFAGETFLSWNRAFIRADDHVLSFFALCPVAILVLWSVAAPGARTRYAAYAINVLIFVASLTGIFFQKAPVISNCLSDTVARLSDNWKTVSSLGATTRQLQARLVEAKAAYSLPRIRAEVGSQSVDVFGYEQGIALLNDLNYTPRPVFQGYSAYTPRLIAANTAFYRSSQAPAFVLVKLQSIDQRHPALDDAAVLRELLFNYTPLFEECEYTLWQRISAPKPITPAPFSSRTLVFDEICPVPNDKNVWVELEVMPSLRGRLLHFLYKPPPVEIHVNDSRGGQRVHRLIPSMSSTGFIINPPLETDRDVLLNALGEPESSTVSFLVHVPKKSRRFFQRRVVCRLAALPELSVETSGRKSRIARYTALFGRDGPIWELAEAFRSASDILVNAGPNGLDGFSALDGVELTATPGGLSIRAEGANPQVRFPKFSPPDGRRAIVRIDLETTIDTGLQLSYRPPGTSGDHDHLMKRCVSTSHRKNAVYFELGEAEMGGALHLDPGDYLITRLEIRALPALPKAAP
jgi:hypothetical protein